MAQRHIPRHYNRLTPTEIALFNDMERIHGNGSAAVRAMPRNYLNPGERAFRIRKKSKEQSTLQYIDAQLQQIGQDAVNRLGMLVNSTDEQVATKNVHYAIDHLKGKATNKSISVGVKGSVQDLLR